MTLRPLWSFKPTDQTFGQIFVVDVFEAELFIVWNSEVILILILSFTLDEGTMLIKLILAVCYKQKTKYIHFQKVFTSQCKIMFYFSEWKQYFIITHYYNIIVKIDNTTEKNKHVFLKIAEQIGLQ